METITLTHSKGAPVERYVFYPSSKLFGFGGDAMGRADWTVKLPIYANGPPGLVERFLVDAGGKAYPTGPQNEGGSGERTRLLRWPLWQPATLGEQFDNGVTVVRRQSLNMNAHFFVDSLVDFNGLPLRPPTDSPDGDPAPSLCERVF